MPTLRRRHLVRMPAPFVDAAEAAAEIRIGRPVIVIGDAGRENQGDLIMAAEAATTAWLRLMIRHTSGIVGAPMPRSWAERLALSPMVQDNTAPFSTAFTVSVDAMAGLTTGTSAAERAATLRALADPAGTAGDFCRPGHVFPLICHPGGVRVRPGHTEAAIALCHLAGRRPVGVIAEVMNDDGTTARLPELLDFGRGHGLAMTSVARITGDLAVPSADS
jgi:3,4-dihydroxy 2-butanone 4-phosphate synthase/GTP cyclohydrolase II